MRISGKIRARSEFGFGAVTARGVEGDTPTPRAGARAVSAPAGPRLRWHCPRSRWFPTIRVGGLQRENGTCKRWATVDTEFRLVAQVAERLSTAELRNLLA